MCVVPPSSGRQNPDNGAVRITETSVHFEATLHYIPESSHRHYRRQNLKSHIDNAGLA
jgi:hypothetical protein